MGGIFSRFAAHVRTKVDNAKQAVHTKVTNVQSAITNKVNYAADAVYKSVENTRKGFVERVTSAKDAVVSRFTNTRDAITNRVNNTIQYITDCKNVCVQRITDTKDAVCTRILNVKNAVTNYYTETRDRLHNRYRRMREAKLTRWQKFKYSVLGLILLTIFSTLFILSLDVYYEEYDRAQERLNGIWYMTTVTAEGLWIVSEYILFYLYVGCRETLTVLGHWSYEAGVHLVAGGVIALHHLQEASYITAKYSVDAANVAFDYAVYFTQIGCFYMWHATKLTATYTSLGAQVFWENFVFVIGLCWEYLILCGEVAFDYTLYGSKVAVDYAAVGARFTYKHGSVALKEGAVKTVTGTAYLLTNFRAASYEGIVYLLESLVWLTGALINGSYYGSVYTIEGVKYTAEVSYLGTIAGAKFTYSSVLTLCDWIYIATTSTYSGVAYFLQNTSAVTQTGAVNLYEFLCTAANVTYNALYIVSTTALDWFCVAVVTSYTRITTSVVFLCSWVATIVSTTAHALYLTLNKHGLHGLYQVGLFLTRLLHTLAHILFVFFSDLGGYLLIFVSTLASHVYNVCYIVITFVYQLLSSVLGTIRLGTGALVYCVTTVFGGIMFVLEETVLAYMYMLQKYNMYREILFILFAGLMTLYCTGLMRDHERSDDSDDSEYETETDDGSDHGDDTADSPVQRVKVKKFALDPYEEPPAYDLEDLPSQDEAVRDPAAEAGDDEDDLPLTDDDDEFDIEHDIPHYLDSGSDFSDPEFQPQEVDMRDDRDSQGDKSTDSSPVDVTTIYPGEQREGDSNLAPQNLPNDLELDDNQDELDLDFGFDEGHLGDVSDEDEAGDQAVAALSLLSRMSGIFSRRQGGS